MRGLGIGILVTALLMGVATKEGRPLTDAEIRAKAYELGMVDGDSVRLTDFKNSTPNPQSTMPPHETSNPQETTAPHETSNPQETAAPKETMEPRVTAEPYETMAPEGIPSPQETILPQETQPPQETAVPAASPAQEQETENDGSGEAVTIVVRRGSNSYSVSVQLAEAGLIEDASAYDLYLCSNGYAGKIRTGTYQIAPGTSDEQIARIITGME